MERISRIVDGLVNSCFNEQIKLHMLIYSNWGFIVGKELENMSSLHSIRKSLDRTHNILYMNIVSSCLLIAKGSENSILNRINEITNSLKVTEISFKHWGGNEEFPVSQLVVETPKVLDSTGFPIKNAA